MYVYKYRKYLCIPEKNYMYTCIGEVMRKYVLSDALDMYVRTALVRDEKVMLWDVYACVCTYTLLSWVRVGLV
jgi:hypothetical protein